MTAYESWLARRQEDHDAREADLMAEDEVRCDASGNPYDPSSCPCCQGEDTFNPGNLCDACTVASLAWIYPHGCDHGQHCAAHQGGDDL